MQENYTKPKKTNSEFDIFFEKALPPCFTNCYQTMVKLPFKQICQYEITLDDAFAYCHLDGRTTIQNSYYEKIGGLISKSYLTLSSNILILNCLFEFQKTLNKVEALFSKTKQLFLNSKKDEALRPQSLQVFHLNLKKIFKANDPSKLEKLSKFFQQNQMEEHQEPLGIESDIIRGCKPPILTEICLQVDNCSRVIQISHLFQMIDQKQIRDKAREKKGENIKSRYKEEDYQNVGVAIIDESEQSNNRKAMKIKPIDWEQEQRKKLRSRVKSTRKQKIGQIVSSLIDRPIF